MSQEFEIFGHEKRGHQSFITIAGGKLALSYGLMAEKGNFETIYQRLKIDKKCTTHTAPLHLGQRKRLHRQPCRE